MKYIIDRIENGFAVCETEEMKIVNISLDILPEEVKEGSVLVFSNGHYALLTDEEEERRKHILSLQDDIFG